MSGSDWRFARVVSTKPQGSVWEVRQGAGDALRRGYFKFKRPGDPVNAYYGGPLVANEVITAALARDLGLPVADLEYARVRGRDGVVSVAAPGRLQRWCDLTPEVGAAPERHFTHPELLAAAFVFDVWVCNVDRSSGKNVMVYRVPGETGRRFYLIDHASCLFGSYWKWDLRGPYHDPAWLRLEAYYHPLRGLETFLRDASRLRPYIDRCRRLPPERLRALIDAVPRRHLRPEEASVIEALLRHRQERLGTIIGGWLRRSPRPRRRERRRVPSASPARSRPRRRRKR